MAYALDLHEKLFAAIEQKYGENAELLQLVPNQLYSDFLPDKDDEGKEIVYPAVCVSQGQEGGYTEECVTGDGIEVADERYPINFEVAADTKSEASQIIWQIVETFKGWHGDYDGVKIGATYRNAPPWVGSEEQGVYLASVGFMVSASAVEE